MVTDHPIAVLPLELRHITSHSPSAAEQQWKHNGRREGVSILDSLALSSTLWPCALTRDVFPHF
eukprot:172701-Amphidinium_carterae.1